MTDQVTCVICLGILYRPAVLPCKHVFCQECILSALEKTAYQCPVCRYRLSNWLRKVKDLKTIVNEDHENQLRDMFPGYYHNKEVGASPMLSSSEQRVLKDLTNTSNGDSQASRGELFSDYLKEVEKFRRLKAIEDQKNEEASLALAFQLLEEDRLSMPENHSQPDVDISTSLRTLPPPFFPTQVVSSSQRKASSKPKRTLLDYSVDTCRVSDNCNSPSTSFAGHNQVAQDEAFARRLQAKYSVLPVSPPTTRSKRRTLRSSRR